jgi:hypothetical protein
MLALFIPAIIGAVGGLVGAGISAWSNKKNKEAQERANAQNQKNQETQWAREDAAYQRKARDLAAAGLNPHLAAGGAGSPSSLSTNIEPVKEDTSGIQAGIMQAASAVAGYQQQKANIAQTQAQTTALQLGNQSYQSRLEDSFANSVANRERIQTANAMVDKQMENLSHNLSYAKEHNLPVGVTTNIIKNTEGILNLASRYKDVLVNGFRDGGTFDHSGVPQGFHFQSDATFPEDHWELKRNPYISNDPSQDHRGYRPSTSWWK